jgi:hypothetical protein
MERKLSSEGLQAMRYVCGSGYKFVASMVT